MKTTDERRGGRGSPGVDCRSSLIQLIFSISVLLRLLLLLVTTDFVVEVVECLENGLALTPPMGWSSWEVFQCNINCKGGKGRGNCISEKLFEEMGDVMVSEGYARVGYNFVNIDDCWMAPAREPGTGQLQADPERFPHGIRHLANHMHSQGLKLGIYENAGRKTCAGFPGSREYLRRDAETFTGWDVDLVKMDGCRVLLPKQLDTLYTRFGGHLSAAATNENNRSKKSILYSCSWPYYQIHYSSTSSSPSPMIPNFESIVSSCNTWRVYHDIKAHWGSLLSTIDFFGDFQEIFSKYSGPGKWADPDMLLIGLPDGLNVAQAKVQFGIWALLPAPLFMSVDLRTIQPKFKEILLNQEVIRINQDPRGLPGKRIFHNESFDIWIRELSPNPEKREVGGHPPLPCYAIGVVNRRETKDPIHLKLKPSEIGLFGKEDVGHTGNKEVIFGNELDGKKGPVSLLEGYTLRDVFEGRDLGKIVKHKVKPRKSRGKPEEDLIVVTVPPTGIVLLKATPYL